MLRIFGVVSRLSGHFPYIIRRGAVEYVIVSGLLVLTIVVATGAIMFFENNPPAPGVAVEDGVDDTAENDTENDVEGEPFDLESSFWFSVYSLFAGEPIPGPPSTLGGKVVAVFVMFMGLTILAALTVEKLNPAVFTCAELMNASYGTHLEMGGVNDYVVSGEYGAYLLAQAATNRGLMSVFTELMTYEHGNEFYRMPMPADCAGKSFNQSLSLLKEKYDVILVAVHPQGGTMLVNPKEHRFHEGDDVVVIATTEPDFS